MASLCKLDVHTRHTRKPKANQAAIKLAKVCKFDVNRRRSSARVRRERQEEEEDVVMVVQFRSAKAGGLRRHGLKFGASECRDTPLMSTKPSRKFNARELALIEQHGEGSGTIFRGNEYNNLVEVEEVQNIDKLAVLLFFGKLALVLLEADKCKLV